MKRWPGPIPVPIPIRLRCSKECLKLGRVSLIKIMPETTYLEAIRQGMWEELERDPNVFLLGEDIGIYGGAFKVTAGMLDKFGARRIIDTPVCESAIVGTAIGAAMMGLRPVVEMQFADFMSCAYDQLVKFA